MKFSLKTFSSPKVNEFKNFKKKKKRENLQQNIPK
jgi:hypothetical protein